MSTTTSTGNIREKKIYFVEPGIIGTGILANVYLSEAVAGQNVYVYLVDESGNETIFRCL